MFEGLPWWLSGTEPTSQWRQCGFDPRIGKIPLRKKWQPTPVFLPGKSHGQRTLVRYGPWGPKKSDTTSRPTTHIYIFIHILYIYLYTHMGFPGSSAGKESTCKARDPSSIPGLGRSPGAGIGYPFQYA